MIPYVEQEVLEYLAALALNLPTMSSTDRLKVSNMLARKHKKIEDFYLRCYADYRAPLILRTIQTLAAFLG